VTVQTAAATPSFAGPEQVGTLGLRLVWRGGAPPFLVQKTTAPASNAWDDVATTEDQYIVVARDSDLGFYRLVDHTDQTVTPFTVWLSGGSERPVVDSPGTGFGTLTLISNTLSVNVSFTGLTAAAVAGHIHGIATT